MRTNLVSAVLMSMIIAGCNAQSSKDTAKDEGDEIVDGEEMTSADDGRTPSDTTGAAGELGISFGNSTEAGLSLDSVESIKISDTIELTLAKFNIAAIKLKGTKDESAKEAERAASGREKEKQEVAAHEEMTEGGAELVGDKGKKDSEVAVDHKAKREGARHIVAGKCGELKEKEREELDQEAKADKSTRFPGPYVYDAIAGTVSGDVPSPISADDGSYHRVEFQLKRHCSEDETDALVGNVFVIHGNVTQGESVVPFEIEWHNAVNLRLAGDKAFAVEPDQENILNVVFDLAGWFDGVDFASAEVDATSGAILVDKQNNREIMKVIRSNIKKHTRFGKDHDKDGKLNADETAGAGDAAVADVED